MMVGYILHAHTIISVHKKHSGENTNYIYLHLKGPGNFWCTPSAAAQHTYKKTDTQQLSSVWPCSGLVCAPSVQVSRRWLYTIWRLILILFHPQARPCPISHIYSGLHSRRRRLHRHFTRHLKEKKKNIFQWGTNDKRAKVALSSSAKSIHHCSYILSCCFGWQGI